MLRNNPDLLYCFLIPVLRWGRRSKDKNRDSNFEEYKLHHKHGSTQEPCPKHYPQLILDLQPLQHDSPKYPYAVYNFLSVKKKKKGPWPIKFLPTRPLDESERGEWKSWLKAQYSENEDHDIWSHHFTGNRWGNSGNSVRLSSLGLQNHSRWWLQPWN